MWIIQFNQTPCSSPSKRETSSLHEKKKPEALELTPHRKTTLLMSQGGMHVRNFWSGLCSLRQPTRRGHSRFSLLHSRGCSDSGVVTVVTMFYSQCVLLDMQRSTTRVKRAVAGGGWQSFTAPLSGSHASAWRTSKL